MADEKNRGGAPENPEDDFGDFLSDGAGPGSPGQSDFGALTGGGAGDEGGLGNLPPLSDFESETAASDRGGFDSSLPPLDEIHPEVPQPTGGNIRPAPPGFEDHRSAFDTPISDSGLDTPQTPMGIDTPQTPMVGGGSFQDLTADSDFSPETPEIGPGPDSDLETPMFDSAFGAGGAFDRTPDTSAPTQAMETPIFGEQGGPSGFDPDAFTASSGAGGLGGGTPIPDFSPDTGIPGHVPPPPSGMDMAVTGAGGAAPARGRSTGTLLVLALVGLLIGAGVGAWFGNALPFTPAAKQIVAKDQEITNMQAENNRLQQRVNELSDIQRTTGDKVAISQEQIDAMIAKSKELTDQIATLETDYQNKQNDLQLVLGELEQKTQEYAEAQQDYEALVNQVSIERARSEGLAAEVQRLQDQVGTLEEAAARSTELKQRLVSDVNRLEVAIQDGIALTPAKYSHEERLAAVRDLKERVANAQVVTPELLDEYTRLYEKEMDIAQTREYFFAKIPVQDRYGTTRQKWAEAVMNGNWSVYFRTLDGRDVGVYERVPGTNPPQYSFRQFLPPATAKQIEQEVIAARVPGYEEKINSLAQREVTMEGSTGVQRVFDSL